MLYVQTVSYNDYFIDVYKLGDNEFLARTKDHYHDVIKAKGIDATEAVDNLIAVL